MTFQCSVLHCGSPNASYTDFVVTLYRPSNMQDADEMVDWVVETLDKLLSDGAG